MNLFRKIFKSSNVEAKQNLLNQEIISNATHQQNIASIPETKIDFNQAKIRALEEFFLTSDMGVEVAELLIDKLKLEQPKIKTNIDLYKALNLILNDNLSALDSKNQLEEDIKQDKGLFVILMVGINGAGKTTTIGKLAKRYKDILKQKVLLVAGDSFRAAAYQQLLLWGQSNDIDVFGDADIKDAGAIVHNAMTKALANNYDVVIIDTAGRLHNNNALMRELIKIKKVVTKFSAAYPHEVQLVLDASLGQNAIIQLQEFDKALGVQGINLTKLDGNSKGGIVFALSTTGIPLRYLGVGERQEDLKVFDSQFFIENLINLNDVLLK